MCMAYSLFDRFFSRDCSDVTMFAMHSRNFNGILHAEQCNQGSKLERTVPIPNVSTVVSPGLDTVMILSCAFSGDIGNL
jgi:hypothetical protein